MKKNQTERLTIQHNESRGGIGIFGQQAKEYYVEVYSNSIRVMKILEKEFPMFEFGYRRDLLKKKIF